MCDVYLFPREASEKLLSLRESERAGLETVKVGFLGNANFFFFEN